MTSVMCPECLLTPSAGRLLAAVVDDFERERPNDPAWRVETCLRCGQPRTIHEDRESWSFGDTPFDADRSSARILDVAPEWLTLHEAAYAARVSKEQLLDWARVGRVEHVSLLPRQDPVGVLLRAADIRAALATLNQRRTATAWASKTGADVERGMESPWRMTRRRVLAAIGATVGGSLLPVQALAGRAPNRALEDKGDLATIDGDGAGVLGLGPNEQLPAGKMTLVDQGGSAPDDASDAAAIEPGAGEQLTGDKVRQLIITSVSVEPDPVGSGAEAIITINTSPKRKALSYSLVASEGVLAQDPQYPWRWIWRDA